MADKIKISRKKQIKVDLKENTGKLFDNKSETAIPKICPSCHNPRWNKTPRNT